MSMEVRQDQSAHPLVFTFYFSSDSDKVSHLTINNQQSTINEPGYERPYSAT